MPFNVFVGLDISKESFSVCAIQAIQTNSERQPRILFEASFPMQIEGFKEFCKRLSRFPKNSILIGKESSGCYHINLFAYLTERHFRFRFFNPLIVSNFMKLSLRKTKTDRTDAKLRLFFFSVSIMSCLRNLFFLMSSENLHPESLIQQIAKVKNDIEKLVVVLFPELERQVNIYSLSFLKLLYEFPSAWKIKSAPENKIDEIINSQDAGRTLSITAKEIKAMAKNSIGHFFPVRELILRQKIDMLFFLEREVESVTSALRQFCEEAALCQDVKILKSIKGIGDIKLEHFLAEVGDINRFSSAKKLIAYCGIDPIVHQSGKFEGKSKLSKRGNRHLRRIIWLMAVAVVMHNQYFKEYFNKRKEEGLPYKKAILAVAHKLLRTIYAMLTKKQPFVSHCFSPCS